MDRDVVLLCKDAQYTHSCDHNAARYWIERMERSVEPWDVALCVKRAIAYQKCGAASHQRMVALREYLYEV